LSHAYDAVAFATTGEENDKKNKRRDHMLQMQEDGPSIQ